MSLITCPECHGQVSDKAAACPHCGYPITDQQTKPKEIETTHVSPVRAHFVVGRIYSGRVYFRCQCGCTVERPFSFINTVGTGTYQLRENLICPSCGTRESAGKILIKPEEKAPERPSLRSDSDPSGGHPMNQGQEESQKRPQETVSVSAEKASAPQPDADIITTTCPHCGQPTNKYKAACENCGKPIVQPTTGAKNAPQDSSGHHVNGVLFVLVAAVVISLILYAAKPKDNEAAKSGSGSSSPTYSSGSSYSGSPGTTSKKYDDDEIKATVYVLAKRCVKNHLKAPSTAEFSEMWECAFTKGEDNVYMMTGYVDSQNSYGAMLQEQWSIMAQVSGDKASLVMLTIGDQVYFD